MKAFVVAAFVCAVAHLTQGGELPQRNREKRGISSGYFGGGADIHGSGAYLGGGDLDGHLGVGSSGGVGSGYHGYGGNNYGYESSATSYNSGIIKGASGQYGNVGAGSYGNIDGHGYDSSNYGPYAGGYHGAGVSHTERYDGHGTGYSKTSHKLANGASTYSKLSYGGGGSKYYY